MPAAEAAPVPVTGERIRCDWQAPGPEGDAARARYPQTAATHATHAARDCDAWLCICGNTPSSDGFYPCDERGEQVEPTAAAWTTDLYICSDCGRMIDPDMNVVARRLDLDFTSRSTHPAAVPASPGCNCAYHRIQRGELDPRGRWYDAQRGEWRTAYTEA